MIRGKIERINGTKNSRNRHTCRDGTKVYGVPSMEKISRHNIFLFENFPNPSNEDSTVFMQDGYTSTQLESCEDIDFS